MKTTLLIMAAGMGSRYGGIKQLDTIGPNGEIIMDYSVFDAIRAGFDKVVIVIRRDIEKDFKEVIGKRLEKQAKVQIEYIFQDLNDLPGGFVCPPYRTKPWGTGQAVLAAAKKIAEPFAVINADDFYGQEPYHLIHDFLIHHTEEEKLWHFCMAGYLLGNTLSDHGKVTRGICTQDENHYLKSIEETFSIERQGNQVVGKTEDGKDKILKETDLASMNMMGFMPSIFEDLGERFLVFLENLTPERECKAEFLLPKLVGEMLVEGKADMKVLPTKEKWFGVTYKEDKAAVVGLLRKLLEKGVYPNNLWG